MKKNKIFMIAALIAGVLALTGCDLFGAVAEVTQDKWCKKTISYSDKPVDVYLYYTNKDNTSEGRIDLVKGLNIVVEATGPSVTIFGEQVGGKYYVTKSIPKGSDVADLAKEAGADNDSAAIKKGLKINDATWLAAYELFKADEKNVSAPESASFSGGYEKPSDMLQADFWREMLAEKLIEILLGE